MLCHRGPIVLGVTLRYVSLATSLPPARCGAVRWRSGAVGGGQSSPARQHAHEPLPVARRAERSLLDVRGCEVDDRRVRPEENHAQE